MKCKRYRAAGRRLATRSLAVVLSVGVATLSACSPQPPAEKPLTPQKLMLRGVTIVDTRDGSLAPNVDLLLDGGRIVGIAPSGSVDPSIKTVDATGKFVVPGYLDMHAHPLNLKDPSGSLQLMLANAITGFRQMAGSAEFLKQRREATLP